MFISASAHMLNIVIDAVYFLIKIITMSWLVITQGHKTIAIIVVHAHARGDTHLAPVYNSPSNGRLWPLHASDLFFFLSFRRQSWTTEEKNLDQKQLIVLKIEWVPM